LTAAAEGGARKKKKRIRPGADVKSLALENLNVSDDHFIVFDFRQKQASPGRDSSFGLLI